MVFSTFPEAWLNLTYLHVGTIESFPRSPEVLVDTLFANHSIVRERKTYISRIHRFETSD